MSLNKSLRSKKEFDLVYKKGKVVSGIFFSLRFLESKNSNEPVRFGIVLGLNISKSSVMRNRKRRQLREIIRLNQDKIRKGYWLIISAKDKILEASYQDLEKEFLHLCGRTGLLNILE
ncbi:MAG: ribonuclease P protein component [Patescibacteria group bacterium]|nr:ribonuclease P protein component [Patescibacteria group bacterium]